MDEMKQIQKAGKDSQQFQIANLVVHQGITEERARVVFHEMIPRALEDYTKEAYQTAMERISRLENRILPRVNDIEGMLPAFANPTFQFLLRKAQQSAALSDREGDYDLLAELLVYHVQTENDRKNKIGIRKAVEIVDCIDNDALCGLTIAYSIEKFFPVSENVGQGLADLSNLFSKLLYGTLPTGREWLDHLDILGAIRIAEFGRIKKFVEFYTQELDGYTSIGIKRNSENYIQAISILDSVGMSPELLVSNIFLEGYVRLPIREKNSICDLRVVNKHFKRSINENEINALKSVLDLYEKNPDLQKQVNEKFIELWDSFLPLRRIRLWWENIPAAFSVTGVGEVLAYTNAKRCEPKLPDLI